MAVASIEQLLLDDYRELWQNRHYINKVIRFLLNAPPDLKRAEKLAQDPVFQSLCEVSEGGARVLSFLHSLFEDNESLLTKAKEEYNFLFVGPNVLPSPPWESVYLGKENLLFEETTLKVRECYKAHGLTFIRENNEPEDHIIIELEFLGLLIEESLQTSEVDLVIKYWVDQAAFLQNHLLRWTFQYSSLLLENAQTGWFQGAALLLKEYILLEKEVCSLIKEVLNNG